jgi:hypothetical protein
VGSFFVWGVIDRTTELPTAIRDANRIFHLKAPKSDNATFIAETTCKLISGGSSLLYNIAWLPNKLPMLAATLAEYLPRLAPLFYNISAGIKTASPSLDDFFHVAHFVEFAGGVASAFRVLRESAALVGQDKFISIFKRFNSTDKLQNTVNLLYEMVKESRDKPIMLERVLPEWLNNKIIDKSNDYKETLITQMKAKDPEALTVGASILRTIQDLPKDLIDNVLAGDEKAIANAITLFEEKTNFIKEYMLHLADKMTKGDEVALKDGKEIVYKMFSYSAKKSIIHMLSMLAGFVSLVGFAALFIACPPLATFMLLGISVSLMVAIYLVRNGYVNNPDGGFSFSRCVPAFIMDWPKFFSAFTKFNEGEDATKQTLENLKKMNIENPGMLERVLPDWLYQDITKNKKISSLLERIKSGKDAAALKEAQELLTQMYKFASDKSTTRILLAVGPIVALAAGVLFVMGMPLAPMIALAAVGVIITLASIAMSRGKVENPTGKFSAEKAFLPESAINAMKEWLKQREFHEKWEKSRIEPVKLGRAFYQRALAKKHFFITA